VSDEQESDEHEDDYWDESLLSIPF